VGRTVPVFISNDMSSVEPYLEALSFTT